jgi:hypothetical protein
MQVRHAFDASLERLKCGDGVFFQVPRNARCEAFLTLLRLPARPSRQIGRYAGPRNLEGAQGQARGAFVIGTAES